MAPDYRALCAELAGWIERSTRHYIQDPDVLIRAYAALAQPVPVVGPTDEELLELWHGSDWFDEGATLGEFRSIARAVLARWGHQLAPLAEVGCPACEGVPKPGNQPCAVCGRPAPVPAEGEVADETRYLVKELRDQADDLSPSLELFGLIHRAADLLEQRHPVPVPMSERLPGAEDCDGEGRCWWFWKTGVEPVFVLCSPPPYRSTHWLPATALPLPQGKVEHD